VSLSLAVRFLHVAAAITWIGGMLFIALVVVPVTRGLEDVALRRRLVQATGRRFRVVGWLALGVLVATGLVNLGAPSCSACRASGSRPRWWRRRSC
jgi:copper resistance protein D